MSAFGPAALAGELGGRVVEVVDVDGAAFQAGLLHAGRRQELAAVVTSFGAASREGHFAHLTW